MPNPFDDDWMHPHMTATHWEARKRDKDEYIIQRKRTVICSWVGDGPPTRWDHWATFDTRKERDAELKRLRAEHTWILRPAFRAAGEIGREEVEDEEGDLLRRLTEIRRRKAAP
jgi:hypothetical protein